MFSLGLRRESRFESLPLPNYHTAPAHPHATEAAVYTALLLLKISFRMATKGVVHAGPSRENPGPPAALKPGPPRYPPSYPPNPPPSPSYPPPHPGQAAHRVWGASVHKLMHARLFNIFFTHVFSKHCFLAWQLMRNCRWQHFKHFPYFLRPYHIE